jgi:hypothetical protein
VVRASDREAKWARQTAVDGDGVLSREGKRQPACNYLHCGALLNHKLMEHNHRVISCSLCGWDDGVYFSVVICLFIISFRAGQMYVNVLLHPWPWYKVYPSIILTDI